jgi:hypothetical protein
VHNSAVGQLRSVVGVRRELFSMGAFLVVFPTVLLTANALPVQATKLSPPTTTSSAKTDLGADAATSVTAPELLHAILTYTADTFCLRRGNKAKNEMK